MHMSWCIESKQFTAVNAGIYGLSVSMGDQFSIDYLAMVGLNNLSADPPKN